MSEEVLAIQGPPVSAEWIRKRKERLAEEDAAADRREKSENDEFFKDLHDHLAKEKAEWDALPCKCDVELVNQCSDDFAQACPRRLHIMCARRQYRELQDEHRRERVGKRAMASRNGVPLVIVQRMWDSSPEDTDARKAVLGALAADNPPVIIVLSGGVGCGKSCAAGEAAIENYGRFITASELSKVSPYEDTAEKIERSKFLVIDDLGVEYIDPKGFFLAAFDSLINYRYSNRLTTIITTNLPASPPKDDPHAKSFRQYGERVLDRIRESGRFINVGGKSLRRK